MVDKETFKSMSPGDVYQDDNGRQIVVLPNGTHMVRSAMGGYVPTSMGNQIPHRGDTGRDLGADTRIPYVVDPGTPGGGQVVDPNKLCPAREADAEDTKESDMSKRRSDSFNVTRDDRKLPGQVQSLPGELEGESTVDPEHPEFDAETDPVDGEDRHPDDRAKLVTAGKAGPALRQVEDTPDLVEVVFSGDFGELEALYHYVQYSPPALILGYRKDVKISRCKPPRLMGKAFHARLNDGRELRVYNHGLAFEFGPAGYDLLILMAEEVPNDHGET